MKKAMLTSSFLLFPLEAFARGGYCGESAFCKITAAIVGFFVFLLFILSVFGSIQEKGVIKGITEHSSIKAIFYYFCMVIVTVSVVYFFLK